MKRKTSVQILCALGLYGAFTLGCSKDSDAPEYEFPKDPEEATGDFYPGEVRPAASIACFAGAYYRKVVSSKDSWVGIGGTVSLPQITFDPDRENPNKPYQYLDNPSVYMGGNSNNQETDIGLTWEVIKTASGSVSPDRRAFRPFLRRTGYSGTGQASNYMNAPAEERYYWYPGDEVSLSLELVRDGVLKFVVEGQGKRYEQEYECDGYRFGTKAEYKRVNAIDQVANEGKPAQATKTKVTGSTWKETYLLRNVEGKKEKAYMHAGRFTDMRCPEKKYFDIQTTESALEKGSEQISIEGGR